MVVQQKTGCESCSLQLTWYSEHRTNNIVLPPFIIDQIRQREERERSIRDQPAIQLPMPPRLPLMPQLDDSGRDPDAPERGVVIIDL